MRKDIFFFGDVDLRVMYEFIWNYIKILLTMSKENYVHILAEFCKSLN